jgi:hypothetical protein
MYADTHVTVDEAAKVSTEQESRSGPDARSATPP